MTTCPCGDITKSHASGASTFISDYKAKFGEDPGIYAAEGWDIAQIYIAAFKAGKTTRDQITNFVRNLQGFQGLAKTYSWQPDGELFPSSRQMYMYQDKGGQWTFLGNAATLTAGG